MLWPELISYQPNDDAQCSCCSRSEKIYRVSIVWHSPFFPVNKFREIVQMATNRISSEQQTKLPFSIFLAVALTLISRFTFLCRCLWVVHYDFMHSNQFSLSLSRSRTPKICCTFSEFIVTVPICSICFSTFKTLLFNFSQIESIDPSECLQNVFVWKLKWV